jgi:hypothetical protein
MDTTVRLLIQYLSPAVYTEATALLSGGTYARP